MVRPSLGQQSDIPALLRARFLRMLCDKACGARLKRNSLSSCAVAGTCLHKHVHVETYKSASLKPESVFASYYTGISVKAVLLK